MYSAHCTTLAVYCGMNKVMVIYETQHKHPVCLRFVYYFNMLSTFS